MENKRRYFRFDLTHICQVALYQVEGVQTADDIDAGFQVVMVDISAGGMKFVTDRDLPADIHVFWMFSFVLQYIQFDLPGAILDKEMVEDHFQYRVQFQIHEESVRSSLLASINKAQIEARRYKNREVLRKDDY